MACALALLVFASSASATNEFELNDTRETAYGPLEGGKPYTATIETENDVDWYLFYVRTYSQMDFSAGMTKTEHSCTAYFRLRNKDGESVDAFSAGFLNQTNHLLLTLNPGRYYFQVESCTKDVYRFEIDPATAITANRECGEAIVSKESIGPQLAKVAGELSKNSEKLARPTELVTADEAALTALSKKREKFLVRWKGAMRRLARNHRLPGYLRRGRMRALIASKRSFNRKLSSEKSSAKAKLATDRATQAKVLEQRAALEAVSAQNKSALSQAESQIAAHC